MTPQTTRPASLGGAVATHTTVLNLDGTITDIPVDSTEQALLRDLATALETLTSSLTV